MKFELLDKRKDDGVQGRDTFSYQGCVNSLLMLVAYYFASLLRITTLVDIFVQKTMGDNLLAAFQTLIWGWLCICAFNVAVFAYTFVCASSVPSANLLKKAALASGSMRKPSVKSSFGSKLSPVSQTKTKAAFDMEMQRSYAVPSGRLDAPLSALHPTDIKSTPLGKLSGRPNTHLRHSTPNFALNGTTVPLQTPHIKRTTLFGLESTPLTADRTASPPKNARKSEMEFREVTPALRSILGTPISHPNVWCDPPKGRVAASSLELTAQFEKIREDLANVSRKRASVRSDPANRSGSQKSSASDGGSKNMAGNSAKPKALGGSVSETGAIKNLHVPFSQLVEDLQLQDDLPFWIEGARIWIHQTIFQILLSMVDRSNAVLTGANLGYLIAEKAFLDPSALRKLTPQCSFASSNRLPQTLVELFQSGSGVLGQPVIRDRLAIELFLNVTGQQLFHSAITRRYILERIKFLAQSRTLAEFNADGGFSSFENLQWSPERFPTDSQLVMHLFCVFMDLTMASFSGINEFSVSRERPFTSKYFIDLTGNDARTSKNASAMESAYKSSDIQAKSWYSKSDFGKDYKSSYGNKASGYWSLIPPFFTLANSSRTDQLFRSKDTSSGLGSGDEPSGTHMQTELNPASGASGLVGTVGYSNSDASPPKGGIYIKPPVAIKKYKAIPAHHTLLVNRCKDEWMIDSSRDNVFITITLFAFYVKEAEIGLLDHFNVMSKPVNMQAIFDGRARKGLFKEQQSPISQPSSGVKKYASTPKPGLSKFGHVSSGDLLKSVLT